MLRTHTCGELRKKDVDSSVTLCGWVDTVRSHGKVNFVDLRDKYGKIQVVIIGKTELKPEYCIKVEGKVQARKAGTENKDLDTGDVELFCEDLEVFNACPVLPFEINDDKVGEDVRLKYRFLDLRSEKMHRNLELRHKVMKAINDFMDKEGFLNIETPILAKTTPEGARDYLVPSRMHPGKFFALPQSPQLFKQLTMIAGYDKYYQIARCMRDEDLRADRQPEFTQLDVEMSFVDVEDILSVMERMWAYVVKEAMGIEVKTPFPRMTYEEAMKNHKSDKPDIRKNKDDKDEMAFLWVTDFPMFEYNKEDKRWYGMHHPFTSPVGDDFSSPGKVASKAYDLVLNGVELASGSIRIHDEGTQSKVFEVLGIKKKEQEEKFGFLLSALRHGAPPHGGIAFGIDRVVQIFAGVDNIREVIAFPKNRAAEDVMLESPSAVSDKQLKETSIKLDLPKKNGKK